MPTLDPAAQLAAVTLRCNQAISFLEGRETTFVERLRRLVDCNSGLDNPAGRLQCLAMIERVYERLGFSCERIARQGDMVHLRAHRPALRPGAPKILILGHFDTVYDTTSSFQVMTQEGPWLHGPGVGDMKGGLVVAQAMLEAMAHIGQLDAFDWLCVHNADEEIQSPTSRDLIEQAAVGRDVCLDFEIGRKTGALVRSRAGVGRYFVTVQGKSAHAGMDHAAGVNAIVGASKLVLALTDLAAPAKGTTINVGVIRGGTKRNIVPDECKIEVDVRITTPSEAARIEREVRELMDHPPIAGTRVTCIGGIGRPPWQRNAACDQLIDHFQATAKLWEFTLGAEDTGGGSDANFTAALGIPTVDGLGPVGEHPHTIDERISRHTLVERAKLVVLALSTLQPPAPTLN